MTAAEARRNYKREWARKHPDKIREYQRRYWTKKAEAAASEAEAASRSDTAPEQKGGTNS